MFHDLFLLSYTLLSSTLVYYVKGGLDSLHRLHSLIHILMSKYEFKFSTETQINQNKIPGYPVISRKGSSTAFLY